MQDNGDISYLVYKPPGRFYYFWAAQATLAVGSRITRQVIPIMAISSLGATAADVSTLHILLFLPAIVVGFWAGGMVDRIGSLVVLRSAMLFRATLLSVTPLLHANELLTWPVFCGCVALYGATATISEIAERSLVPEIVPKDQLVHANSKLATTDATAEIIGPLVMGALLAVMTPVNALVADAACFIIAFLLVLGIGTLPKTQSESAKTDRGDARLAWVKFRANVMITILLIALIASTFGSEWMRVVYTLYALTVVGLTPFELGVTFAAGGVGLLTGATLARIPRLAGNMMAMGLALVVNAFGLALFPIASFDCCGGIGWLVAGQFISDTGLIVFLILARSYLQRIVAAEYLPHMFALLAISAGVMICVGAIGAGIIATFLGPTIALLAPPLIKLAGALPLLLGYKTHYPKKDEV